MEQTKQPLTLDLGMTFRIKKELVKDYDEFVGYMVDKLFKDFDIIDVDGESSMGRHIFVEVLEGQYTIRTWNVRETDKTIVVDFTIYKDGDWIEQD
jgi:hypothetical protein